MKHPEILLVPVLLLSDWFLTVLGAIEKEKKHSQHFKTPHYELNPIWQKAIAKKKWFNPRHLLITTIVTLLFFCVTELIDNVEIFGGLDFLSEGLLGFVFVLFGMIIGRHLSNLLIFRQLAKMPNDISGQISMSHLLSLRISSYSYLVATVPMVIVAVFVRTPFVIGGAVGSCMILAVHLKWIVKHRRQMDSTQISQPAPATTDPDQRLL
jgi:hypothetical protein